MAERFRSTLIKLNDEDLLSGFVTAEDDETITLVDEDQVHRIERSRIARRALQESSLMPAALLSALSFDEIRDLLTYLSRVGEKEAGG